MPSPTTDLLLHPVRLRLLQSLLGGEELTTSELASRLPDVPAATLYRHVARLADAGVLQVVRERAVRGTVERTFALDLAATQVREEELRTMTRDEHRQAFTVFVAGLLGAFDRYLDHDDLDLVRDGVSYRQTALWLSDAELEDLVSELGERVRRRMAQRPAPGRTRRLLTTVLLPEAPAGT
jgi:DNA-binding transcriptional ArsR family regulator